MNSTRIRTRGLTFVADVHGAGDRQALLLHGFPDSPRGLAPLARRLAEQGYRCVVPWMRGPGATGCAPDGDYSVHRLAHDVIDLLDSLEAEAPLVVGHDWGAVAATSAAALAPDRFGHLVAVSVPPVPAMVRALLTDGSQRGRSAYLAKYQLPWWPEYSVRRPHPVVRQIWRRWSPSLADPQPWSDPLAAVVADPVRRRALFGPYRALLPRPGRVDAWRRSLALARMQVRVPTLFMVGEEDGCIAPSAFADATRYVDARSAVCCIPGAGHFVTVEAPDAMAREILGFVAAEEPGHG